MCIHINLLCCCLDSYDLPVCCPTGDGGIIRRVALHRRTPLWPQGEVGTINNNKQSDTTLLLCIIFQVNLCKGELNEKYKFFFDCSHDHLFRVSCTVM